MLIDVSDKGAVRLGSEVVCDGFVYNYPFRFQTHIHDDHMDGFETSKGYQDILLHPATMELLVAEKNADLPYRSNLIPVQPRVEYGAGQCRVYSVSNGHMLGSVQVAVQLPDGARVGYSGDFQWPLEEVIEVDALVADSTYGSPSSRREYSQEEAAERLIDLVRQRLRYGPVIIKAHRGTLQRGLELLDEANIGPILASQRLQREAAVYAQFGYSIPRLVLVGTADARSIAESKRYVRLIGTRDPELDDRTLGTRIILSAYISRPDDPVLQVSETAYRVALSGHADFEGTIAYTEATRAKYVVTDNSRGGHGVELALELRRLLGIEAVPSSQEPTRSWGQ
jgi:putative mRNA 3-end processing factor